MILKEYQQRTLATVREFVEQLSKWREKEREARRLDPEFGFDWVRRAWEKTAVGRPYHERKNAVGDRLPSFCLKIPTGGGKTLLAVRVIGLVNSHFRRSRRGLVLWIVPTTQIYRQTLRALRDLDHPYRQQLDLCSGQRTRILEKTTPFGPRDIEESLCVLLLMLPSANRQTKDTLRMFRDSGGYDRFFPPEDQPRRHAEILARTPNLDTFEETVGHWGRIIKTSLGNTLRLLRPLIVLDEGHKAYSANAKATLEGFNPCMIVELSATPAKEANVLVEILGRELNAEEMIKLDLHIRNQRSGEWRDTLLEAVTHRERLEAEAERHEADSGAYIRPICVIQVERTGRSQRKPGLIHAEDVREHLLQRRGVTGEQIAVKTSSKDELREADDVGGLMSRNCPIRYIITKQALQEGWDCPFAYVLAILANPSSRTGLTQLVGRILRQPYAHKTGVSWLDESYVFCYRRGTNDVLKEVRKGFGLEGLQGLEGRVVSDGGPPRPAATLVTRRRDRFQAPADDLVLPAFMIRDEGGWRLVRYEADILSRVPWDEVDVAAVAELSLDEATTGDQHIQLGLDGGTLVGSGSEARGSHGSARSADGEDPVDYLFAAHHLLHQVPNPWRGRDLVRRAVESLLERYPAERVAANEALILATLGREIEKERDRLSRQVFGELLDSGAMRFLVVTEDLDFNRLPETIETPKAKRANREDGSPFQRNLFDITLEDDLNRLENKVATYLDQQARLFFWYRNRARKDYFVQAWKPQKIYADFIVTLREDEPDVDDGFHQVFVVETKGVHLKQSEDTDYKRSVFDICTEHARKTDWARFAPAMRDKVVRFEVVDEDEWRDRLNWILFGSATD